MFTNSSTQALSTNNKRNMETLFIPLHYTVPRKPPKSQIVFDYNESLSADEALNHFVAVCERLSVGLTVSGPSIVAVASGTSLELEKIRKTVLKNYREWTSTTIPLEAPLAPQALAKLEEIAHYCSVEIIVTQKPDISIFGEVDLVAHARHRVLLILNWTYGYTLCAFNAPQSVQPAICGPGRQHLRTLFQQTRCNVYTSPITREASELCTDEVWIAGEPAQMPVAQKILEGIFTRTESYVQECRITEPALDGLNYSDVEKMMVRHATFIQLPPRGSGSTLVRVQGANRSSIQRSVEELMHLAGAYYSAIVECEAQDDVLIAVAATGVTILGNDSQVILYGESRVVKRGIDLLASMIQCGRVRYILEQANTQKEFILGKKQGKVLKIMNTSSSTIALEPLHEHNFRISIESSSPLASKTSIRMLEGELPAEKLLYVPESFHKQVIGAGGQTIQSLMRKHNVFIRFGTSGDKYPNAFGNLIVDNVTIRCPAKNSSSIDAAAEELQGLVEHISTNQQPDKCWFRLTRNHRRLLLSECPNLFRDIEFSTGASIKLPNEESLDTQIIEISGLKESPIQAAHRLKEALPRDYQFLVPWSPRFSSLVGPDSDFALSVAVPLFLGHGAHVQAFEKVQLQEDPSEYSQIVVSFSGLLDIARIERIITVYLRRHGLDLVDKGELKSNPIIFNKPAQATAPLSTNRSNLETPVPKRRLGDRSRNQLHYAI